MRILLTLVPIILIIGAWATWERYQDSYDPLTIARLNFETHSINIKGNRYWKSIDAPLWRELVTKFQDLKPATRIGLSGEQWTNFCTLYISRKRSSGTYLMTFVTRKSLGKKVLLRFEFSEGVGVTQHGYYDATKMFEVFQNIYTEACIPNGA